MNMTKILQRLFVTVLLAAVVSTPCFAVEYFLRADTMTKPMPGGVDVPMWGFAKDTGFGTLDGEVTVPGPTLTVPEGDANLTIHLDNNLNVPVSLVINGQIAVMTPVRSPDGRVYSFTHETPPGNTAAVDYVWTNFQPGTYAYQSGTHVAVQVQMGLYGGVTRDFAAGQIYDDMDTMYDVQVPLFFSEIDTALHTAVATDNYGPGKAMTSTIDYEPDYFLINGQPFTAGQAAIAAGDPGDIVLLRLFNMGLETRCPLLLGTYMTQIAEDGHAYQYSKQAYVANLTAGKTIDAIVTFPTNGRYPIFDRRLGLTNAQASGGGMLAYLQVGPLNASPVINSVTATPASILDTQTSQLQVSASDTDGPSPLSYNWIVPAGAGSVSNAAIANPTYLPPDVAVTQIFTLTVQVSDGMDTAIGTIDITVDNTINIAPVINATTATPASILDTQTSQLLVNATDTDGPSPLSYNWIVPAGAGSVSNAAIANPIYTPSDVAASQIVTLTVQVSDGVDTVIGTVDVTVSDSAPQPIFTATFNVDTDGFGYLDNTFRGATASAYASGVRVATGGFTGGALQVLLGGIDNITVLGIAGGWQRTFTLAAPSSVDISFRYNMTQLPSYDADENSDMMFSIDGVAIGTGGTDYLARLTGNGNGGPSLTTGWQLFTTTVNLSAGSHTITIGGHNNKKSSNNEMTTILVDDVSLTGSGPAVNTPPTINSVTSTPATISDTQTSQLLVSATDTDGPSALTYNWIVPAGAGSVSDAAIANPIYTPSDVAATQIFTLTVEVSDGAATTVNTVDITVNDTAVINTAPVINSVTATPASIITGQTSQLLADASDTDGPAPLSYNWIVPAGAGSVSNPAIANPVYTPPVVVGTQVFTVTVEVSDGQDLVAGTVDITVSADSGLFSASFNVDTDGFGYLDNTFRDGAASAYASGVRVATGGFTGGALQIQLGGIDNVTVLAIAGGWQRTFNLAAAGNVQVSFRYNMTQLPSYDADENSDMMFSIDGVAIGTGGTDYLARLTGNGNGGPSLTTGWQLFTTTVSLPAGSHTITIGGYNNKKTSNNEMTTILIDDVTLVNN